MSGASDWGRAHHDETHEIAPREYSLATLAAQRSWLAHPLRDNNPEKCMPCLVILALLGGRIPALPYTPGSFVQAKLGFLITGWPTALPDGTALRCFTTFSMTRSEGTSYSQVLVHTPNHLPYMTKSSRRSIATNRDLYSFKDHPAPIAVGAPSFPVVPA